MSGRGNIFIVMADTAYEGSTPVRGFESEPDAKALVQRCRDHEEKRPRCPEVDASDEEWDKYLKRQNSWETRHPAKPHHYHCTFSVMPLPFKRKPT